MISKIVNIFKVSELRKKITFTAALLFVFRLGGIVLVPGVDREVVKQFIAFSETGAGSIFGLYNLVAGGFFLSVFYFCTRNHAIYFSVHYSTSWVCSALFPKITKRRS